MEQLRAAGSAKWSTFPRALGAFVAEMDFGTAPAVQAALHGAVDAGTFGYLPTRLADEMAEAFAAFAAERYGWELPPTAVHPLPDVIAGFEVAIDSFSPPGAPIILPTPAYMPFLTVPARHGRQVIEVPMPVQDGRSALDLEAIEQALILHPAPDGRAGMVVLTNPANPVGRVFTRAELSGLAEVVERQGARVFVDEIHAPLVYDGATHVPYATVSEAAAAHSITATSASKGWNLPGLKCAQIIITNEPDAATWADVGFFVSHGASTLGVIANTAAYRDGVGWLDEVRAYLDGNRRLLGDLLADQAPEIGYLAPEGTYLAWLDVHATPAVDSGRVSLGAGGVGGVADYLRDHAGVALIDGPACGQAGRGFVRLNFATPRPILVEIVQRLAAALRTAN